MSESEESNISDECAEQTAPAEVVDLSQGFDSDGWDLYNVENLGLGPLPSDLIGIRSGGAIFCAHDDKVRPQELMKRIVADQPDLFAIDRSSFYDKRRRQDPIDPITKWKHDDFTSSVRALEQFLRDMSGLQNYNLYEPVIISNTGGVLDQQVYFVVLDRLCADLILC